MHPILIAKELELGYDAEPSILTGIDFEVKIGDFIGVTGPNGAGKTTFLRALLGLIKPRRGSLTFYTPDGEVREQLSIGYMPQQNHLDRAFPISAEEVVVSGLMRKGILRPSREERAKARTALQMVGLGDQADRQIGTLSGGQLQRILLARAFVGEPDILVLDEPTTYVDRQFEETLGELLPTLHQGRALIMVSHNVEHLKALCTQIYHIDHSFAQI